MNTDEAVTTTERTVVGVDPHLHMLAVMYGKAFGKGGTPGHLRSVHGIEPSEDLRADVAAHAAEHGVPGDEPLPRWVRDCVPSAPPWGRGR